MAHGIEEVAKAAGVSTATVSRALRGLPNVSDSTRRHVREVADALGYVPSPSASSLATGRTGTIGLITPWVNHWFFSNVIEGAERALRAEGFDALLHTFDSQRERPRATLDPSCLRRRVDGVLVVGMPLSDSEIAAIVALGQPVIFVGTGGPGHVTVRLDDLRIGREATEHLLALGHRAIGHLTGGPRDVAGWAPAVQRELGWRRALAAAGVTALPAWSVDGQFDLGGARAATHALLDAHPEITAVFAASDEMAMGAILAAQDRGLRVGAELSVIGVDGHDLGELLGLTTMAQPAVEQGATAATMLLEMITGAPVPAEVVYTTSLVERSSTAPCASRTA